MSGQEGWEGRGEAGKKIKGREAMSGERMGAVEGIGKEKC